MKHIHRSTTFAFIATVIILSVFCFQLTQAKGEEIKSFKKNDIQTVQTVQIELKKPITLDTLFPAGTNLSSNRMILEGEFIFNDEAIYDFYIVNPKNEKKNIKIKEEYIKNRKAFLADTKKISQLSFVDSKNVENILVTKITIMGRKGDIDKMKKGLEISKIDVKPDQFAIVPQLLEKSIPKEIHLLDDKIISSKESSAGTKDVSLDELVPNSGVSQFNPSVHGGRYVYQTMNWDLPNFSEEQTYEHDLFLYNYDGKTYLDGSTTLYPGCWPEYVYAATSLPAAYVDTRFDKDMVSCEIEELAYTIGVTQASALQAHVEYYIYIRTENGNDLSDKFKLQGQIGHRSPSDCHWAWCSWGDESFNIIPSWSTTVPGTQAWTYHRAPIEPSNVSINNPTAISLQVNFTDNATNETSILVERKGGTSGNWILLGGFGVLPGTGNWYWTNTGLLSGYVYCYRLKAINEYGSSVYSNEACNGTL